ncbi:AAA domain-containing protein [Vibrio gazogenes]|uniref:DNA helicase n=1 Tax=Vibrio gazogenes TaxID=687 RepID=A0A1Z2SKP3_VIBGA|nr:AAA domain-containing protein [Vibrio gazogenes]ASA57696.1 DNA helicase [Vibrio gazogenes]
MNHHGWIDYWRNSLADADSAKGGLKKQDRKNYERTTTTEFKAGKLDSDSPLLKQLFHNESDAITAVNIHLRPVIYSLRKVHSKDYSANMPGILTPILCSLWVNREGMLFPNTAPFIPRDLLAPQGDDTFTIAHVDELDKFLTINEVPTLSAEHIPAKFDQKEQYQSHQEDWNNYYGLTQKLFTDYCNKNGIEQFYEDLQHGGLVNKVSECLGASRHILKLYDNLSDLNTALPLLDNYAAKTVTNHEACIDISQTVNLRLGHSNHQFPLATAQRDALAHTLAMQDGDMLAVNGPPGTGKTTFVLSVVASLWIESALKESQPPLIIAASTNNQAVTNIIDAFGKDFDEGDDALSGRWLPNIFSYGGYLPSASSESKEAKRYQTKHFYEQVEQQDFLDRAAAHYFEQAKLAFPQQDFADLQQIKAYLLTQLRQSQTQLDHIQTCWHQYSHQLEHIHSLLGNDPEQTLAKQQSAVAHAQESKDNAKKHLTAWRTYLANESVWLALFQWLPPIKNKLELQRKNFILSLFDHDEQPLEGQSSDQFEQLLEQNISTREDDFNAQEKQYQTWLEQYQSFEKSQQNWLHSIKQVTGSGSANPIPQLADIDSVLDITTRFRMFRLAVHYWEVSWLLSCRELGNELNKQIKKTGLKVVRPRWRRRMMLTPCIVSTFHSLPAHMTYQSHIGNNEFETNYLLNEIDLLIVDEAGQVSPEVAAASFALAKKALVIGDTYQIAPIRNVCASIDRGNLKQHKIIASDNEYTAIQEAGRSVVTGSAMHVAQQASRFHYISEAEPGMFLQEHRRCYDELISYCNDLCYQGMLIPKRGKAAEDTLYPPFCHLHIDGIAESFSGSRCNKLEAETIAAWLNTNREKIERYYNQPLAKCVGIITPFSAQVSQIRTACNQYDIKTEGDNQLTVGTVHALQGAERKIIIFSHVYTRHNDGGFIDRDPSMLNVAVSRAKDSFLVFGDLDIIEAAPSSTPRGLLAKYLFTDEQNELEFKVGERPDLLQACGQPKLLTNAEEHDLFLSNLLSEVKRKIDIVSPWIFLEKLQSTGLLEQLKTAQQKGVQVTIHTDRHFNTTRANRPDTNKVKAFQHCCSTLGELGIMVNVIHGVHSKSIFADDRYMAVGSFNWFSASRSGKYANIETSLIYIGELEKEIKTQLKFLNSRGDYINKQLVASA